jgi:TonB family protein
LEKIQKVKAMTTFILYQIKAGICIMLFTGLYFLILRKETFYLGNRIYLLGSLALSALLPLIRIPLLSSQASGNLMNIVNTGTYEQTDVYNLSAPVEQTPFALVVYKIVAVLFALQLIYQLYKVLILVRKTGIIRISRYRVISLPQKAQSFSFFSLIFISSPTSDEINNSQVLQHEMAHARQWHSLDIMIIQIFKIFQWFNPFIYLAEKALQETHEYLADEAVMEQDGDSGGYRLLLLTQVFGVQPGIFSLFNYSLIKNRLIMMTKQKSHYRKRLKYVAVLPLIAAILMLNCTNKEADEMLSSGTNQAEEFPPPPPPPPPMNPDEANKGIDPSKVTDQDTIFMMVSKQAEFQGGTLENFRDWVQKNVHYPEKDIKNGVTGKVYVQFVVNSKGKVSTVKILRGVSPSLDQEVFNVISSSPDWVPGSYKGYALKQQFVMPVIFGDNPKSEIEEEPSFVFVEKPAEFQGGGLQKFALWVQQNLNYPEEAVKKGIFGKVTVQFAVNKNGNVCDVKTLRGVDPILDKEAIRVLMSSPEWTPASQGGNEVKQQFVMPVIFQLK